MINFWKGVVFLPSSPESGPAATYQLGLITDPHGSLIMKSKGTFPFVDFETVPGLRAPLGNFGFTYPDEPHTFNGDNDALFIQRMIEFFNRELRH